MMKITDLYYYSRRICTISDWLNIFWPHTLHMYTFPNSQNKQNSSINISIVMAKYLSTSHCQGISSTTGPREGTW